MMHEAADAVHANGTTLNGTTLNGISLNGITFNGTTLNGITFNGTTLNGTTLNGAGGRAADACHTGVRLEGTSFQLQLGDGRTLSGEDFEGGQFAARLSNGERIRLRIDDVEQERESALFTYEISYQTMEGWQSLCGTTEDGRVRRAIPLSGRWDYRAGIPGAGGPIADEDTFTFACEGFALAKCVKLGYRPWEQRAGVPLSGYHAACVRMLRADFCGDGRSWTEDGTLINTYDALGIQEDAEAWSVEAEWTAAGARCMGAGSYRRYRPTCHDELAAASCGDVKNFQTGTLLMSEVPPSYQ